MEELCICKICKKVFTDKHGLRDHQMTTHPIQQQQLNNNEQLIPQQFRNHSNISITRIPAGGGVGKEFNRNSQVVIQSGTMNQNQNILGRKTAGPPSSMKMKQGEGARVKTSYRSPPEQRLKQAPVSGGNSSVRTLVSNSLGLDDATTDWRKWTPPARAGPELVPPNRPRTTDGQIITQSAAERAMLAIPQTSAAAANAATARKNVPKLLPMVPQGNKRGGAGAQRVALASPGTSGTGVGVANIMKNLGKMKDLSLPSRSSTLNSKLISLGQVNKKAIPPPPIPVVNKLPASRKQKIVPRNSFNNALPVAPPSVATSKPRANTQPNKQAAAGKRIPPVYPPPSALELEEDQDDDMVIDDQQPEEAEDEEDFDEEPEPLIQPAKKSVPAAIVAPSKAAGGKAPPQKKNVNVNNRFNPIQTSPKKGKGAQGSPNGKSAKVASGGGGAGPSTSASAANGTNKKSAAGVASAAGGSGGGAVVAKKSNAAAAKPPPPPKAKGKKKKEDTLTRLKNYVPTMPGTDYEMPKLSAIGSYTNRQGQQVWVCLVCNEKESENSSKDMICCEMCEDWYHWECVGILESMAEDDPWYCKRCIFQACAPNKAKKDFPKIFKNDVFD